MPKTVNVKTKHEARKYSIEIRCGGLDGIGTWARTILGPDRKIAVVSNKRVFGLYGHRFSKSLAQAGFDTEVCMIGDGERFKDLKTFEKILDFLSKFNISRTDVVIGFGGGIVGDVAGFAASVHLRGVDYLSVPTTLLSMVDSSVGGKTGINTDLGKNRVGTFFQPKGVMIDPEVLATLSTREVTAGFCECIKQGAIAGRSLFKRTDFVLKTVRTHSIGELLQIKDFRDDFESFIAAQIAFKAKIVAVDEKEAVNNIGPRSRKVLNFGHTFAHALEKASGYRHLKHGEAVGYGIVFAAILSKKLGLLDGKVVNLLCDVVHRAGKLPLIHTFDKTDIFTALSHDKKKIGNSLQWVLLKDIGKPVIVPHSEVGDRLVRKTIEEFISAN